MSPFFRKPPLTRSRVILALTITILADALQLFLGPFGWAFVDQVIDLVAMILLSSVIGFHVLFLPTFVAEFIPGVGMLPTWTGCALFVIAQRRKHSAPRPPPPKVSDDSDVIDV
jgi:hypothetical protein